MKTNVQRTDQTMDPILEDFLVNSEDEDEDVAMESEDEA